MLPLAMSSGAAQATGLQAGQHAYEASDYAKAAQLLFEAAEAEPRNAEILLLLTKTHLEMQQFDAAVKSAEKAVALEPKSSAYHEWLGRAYGEKADHSSFISALSLAKKTRKEFQEAVELDERNFAARQALIEFDCAAPAMAGGGEDKAQPEIAQTAALDAAEGHYAAGNCRRQKKDFAAADAEFNKALQAQLRAPERVFDIGDYAARRSEAAMVVGGDGSGGENCKQRSTRKILSRGGLDTDEARRRRSATAAARVSGARADQKRLPAPGDGALLAGAEFRKSRQRKGGARGV